MRPLLVLLVVAGTAVGQFVVPPPEPPIRNSLDDLRANAAALLEQPDGVASVERLVAVDRPHHRIIHIRDWHWVPFDFLSGNEILDKWGGTTRLRLCRQGAVRTWLLARPVVGQFKGCRLRQITGRLRAILLEKVENKRFWVRAQLVVNKGGPKAGHCYCDLVDTDEGGQKVAKMRAIIWRPKFETLRRKCREAGYPDALANNQEVCVHCSVTFHEVHGLGLEIHDVDPSFGEGQIDRNRRVILEGLKRDGLRFVRCPIGLRRLGLSIIPNVIYVELDAGGHDLFCYKATSPQPDCVDLTTWGFFRFMDRRGDKQNRIDRHLAHCNYRRSASPQPDRRQMPATCWVTRR